MVSPQSGARVGRSGPVGGPIERLPGASPNTPEDAGPGSGPATMGPSLHSLPTPEDDRPAELGPLIRARRQAIGLTLAELADRAGCAASYLSAVETGARGTPKPALLEALEAALRLERGSLTEAAAWAQTPASVRRAYARLAAQRRALDDLVRGLRGGPSGGPEDGPAPMQVPVIGPVATCGAGEPGPGPREAAYVTCPGVDDPDAFAARLVGDGMSPAYRAGDVVVFSPARAVEAGADCLVTLVRGQRAVFGRVYFDAGETGPVRVQPTNTAYVPVVVDRGGVAGVARAVRLIREV